MTLVDHSRGIFKLGPNLFSDLSCHGAYLAPLLMESLETLEGIDRVRKLGEFLSLLHKGRLDFKIFLEIKIAKLLVHFQTVVELLNCQLI